MTSQGGEPMAGTTARANEGRPCGPGPPCRAAVRGRRARMFPGARRRRGRPCPHRACPAAPGPAALASVLSCPVPPLLLPALPPRSRRRAGPRPSPLSSLLTATAASAARPAPQSCRRASTPPHRGRALRQRPPSPPAALPRSRPRSAAVPVALPAALPEPGASRGSRHRGAAAGEPSSASAAAAASGGLAPVGPAHRSTPPPHWLRQRSPRAFWEL